MKEQTEERTITKVEYHFGGLHKTFHMSDGTTINVYEDGYRSNNDRIPKTFSPKPNTMNNNTDTTDTTVSADQTATPAKVSKKATKVSKSKKATKKPAKATVKKKVARADVGDAAPAPTAAPKKPSSADVKAAIENFLKNPPDKPLSLVQVYEVFGFQHSQVYNLVRTKGIKAHKAPEGTNGRMVQLFTFAKE